MSILKSDEFISDLEGQFEWYAVNADWNIAERYLQSVEATCDLLGQHPLLGPQVGFSLPHLVNCRFIVVCRPFHKHILLYEIEGGNVALRRAMHATGICLNS
jgi:plasmid stabilization system protein ParE